MMPLISDAYRAEQHYLHFEHPKKHKYGSGGPQWADTIRRIAITRDCFTILDYGCGKGLLAKHLGGGITVQCYDPAIPAFSRLPIAADMVVCLDVLEHIEPDYLDNVLDHLRSLAGKYMFIAISRKVAGRSLRDGRNAHLIIKDDRWWLKKFEDRGCVLESVFASKLPEFVALFRSRR